MTVISSSKTCLEKYLANRKVISASPQRKSSSALSMDKTCPPPQLHTRTHNHLEGANTMNDNQEYKNKDNYSNPL